MKIAGLMAMFCLSVVAEPQNWSLSLAANGSDAAVVNQGWPVVLRATVIWSGDDSVGQVAFDMFDPAVLVWKITSSSGAEQKWPVVFFSGPRQKTRIDAKNDMISLVWGIGAEQTVAAKGDYLLVLTAGKAQAKIHIRIDPSAASSDGQNEWRRRLVFAEYDLSKGDAAAALAVMQEELKAHPDNVSAMSLAAHALEKLNRKPEALAVLGGALDLAEKQQASQPGLREPMPDLRKRYAVLLKDLTAHPPSVQR